MVWWLLWVGIAQAQTPPVRSEPQEGGGTLLIPEQLIPEQSPKDASKADSLLMSFSDVSLYDLTAYFATALRKNFLLNEEAALKAKKVRIIGHDAMTVEEAWEAYRSTLRSHGYTLVETDRLITVVPIESAIRSSIDVRTGAPSRNGETFVTQLLPVRNGRASEFSTIIAPLMSSEAQLTSYGPANTLIVTDTASNVKKAAEIVAALDVAAPETTLVLLPLQHATASEVRAVIEALFAQDPSSPEPKRQAPKHPKSKVAAEPAGVGEVARHVSKVLDDPRTNTLIVLANPDGHRAVAGLVADLDVDVDESERKRLHVIRLKYALAEEVATVVTQLQSQTPAQRPALARPAKGEVDPQDDAFEGTARVAADPATNALAVVASKEEYASIAALVAELDVARSQVFVDAVFVELTSTDGKELAIGAHVLPSESFPGIGSAQLDAQGKFNSFAVSPELLSGLAAGVFGPALDVVGPDGSLVQVPTFGIALRALQTNSDLQVMGNPALLALDHEEASLSVGRKIPFPSSNQLTAVGLPIQTFERIDVAMTLQVTPHINDSSWVTLDLSLEVDEVEGAGAETGLLGGPITSSRSVKSRVMVENGQTVVLAGVAGTKVESSETKVPILGDIPLIGALFRGRHSESRRTHLMVFLTPYIVERPVDLLAIRRVKEAQRQEFVRRFQGKRGEDWMTELQALLTPAIAEAEPIPEP